MRNLKRVIPFDPSKQRKDSAASTSQNVASPFSGYTAAKTAVSGGKQKKKSGAGVYTKGKQKFYIKSSVDYPADDIAEVFTSKLLGTLIEPERATSYEFVKSDKKEVYVASEMKNGALPLAEQQGVNQGSVGWLASNPVTKANKDKIHQVFKGQQEAHKDMAYILAGCLLLGEKDCQVKNILIYQEPDPKNPSKMRKRACKFDDGWGLADICKNPTPDLTVELYKSTALGFGSSGTHKNAAIPTNHYLDYPEIIKSADFVEALRTVSKNATDGHTLQTTVAECVRQMKENFSVPDDPDDPDYPEKQLKQLKAFEDFAQHIQVKVPYKKNATTGEKLAQIETVISSELEKSLRKRAASMLELANNIEQELNQQQHKKQSVRPSL